MTFKTDTFPVKAWRLTDSFNPVEDTVLREFPRRYGGFETEKRYFVRADDLFYSKDEAIHVGWSRIAEQRDRLKKMEIALNKKSDALTKAAQS